MPNNTLFQVAQMQSSTLLKMKSGSAIAFARGFEGVRTSAGLGGFGGTARISAASLANMTEGITYAASLGLSKVSVLLGFSPKRDGAHLITFNGGVAYEYQNRPPAGTGNGIWLWIVQAHQDIIDTCRAAAIAAGKDPTTFLEFEIANEINKGGVSGPKDSTGAYSGIYGAAMNFGTIEAAWFAMAEYITSRTNYHSIPLCHTLEGDTSDSDNPDSGGTDQQTEVDSWTGANAISYLARLTTLNFNCYARAPSTPYDAAAVKADFSTKVQAQKTIMAANAVIGGKATNLREFGIKKEVCPSCTVHNTVCNDLIVQVKAESGIAEGCLYTCYNLSSSTASGSDLSYYCYEQNDTPRDSVHIAG